MTWTATTEVYILPNGNVAYGMGIWFRELGPMGRDYGNHLTLPKGAIKVTTLDATRE